jgi:hypothetical protein
VTTTIWKTIIGFEKGSLVSLFFIHNFDNNHIWKTIIGFGPKGRALVLTNIFFILDRDLVPQQRTVSILIRKNIFWFLGENGNVLVNDIATAYYGNVSPDVS